MRLLTLMLLLLCADLAQAREPLGPEFRVNTTTFGNQGGAANGSGSVMFAPVAAAARADGGFIVVWNQQSGGQPLQPDFVPGGIYAQLYAPNGSAEGAEFRIGAGDTLELDVAMAPDGAFVVIWQDSVSRHIMARRYTAAGQPAGDALVVSDTVSSRYTSSGCPRDGYNSLRVAVAADGAFVVIWACGQGSSNFPSGSVFGRYYDGDGFPTDGYISLGNFNEGGGGFLGGTNSDVLMTAGGYLVVNPLRCRVVPDGSVLSTPCGQHFNTVGESQGNPIPLGPQQEAAPPFNPSGTFTLRLQAARDAVGNFAVISQRELRDEFDNRETRLVLGRYDADGAPLAGEFTFPAGEALRNLPVVAASGSGEPRFVAAYQRDAAGDSARSEIVAREFGLSSNGPASFIAHTNTTLPHRFPAVAVDADGDYVLAWTRPEQADSPSDVFVRRFGNPPPAGSLRFDGLGNIISEGIGTYHAIVERIGGSSGAASARVRSAESSLNDAAQSGGAYPDFNPVDQVLNWADGDAAPKTVPVLILDDSSDEDDQGFSLLLESVAGAQAGDPSFQIVTITDNDDPPRIDFAAFDAAARAEDSPPINLTLNLSAPSQKDIQVAYVLSGSAQSGLDYTVSPLSPVSIPAGQTEARITFTPVDDAVEEPEELIQVGLDFVNSVNVAEGAQRQQTVTLAASDAAGPSADLRALLGNPATEYRINQAFNVEPTVYNFGPNAAQGVTSRLVLSEGRIESFFIQPELGSCTRSNLDRTLSCAINSVAVDQSIPLLLLIEAPPEPGDFTLTHDVFGGPGDPVSSNNFLTKTFSARLPNPGVVGFQATRSEHEEPVASETGIGISLGRSTDGEEAASVGFRVLAEGGNVPATAGSDYRVITTGRLALPMGGSTASIEIDLDPDLEPEDFEGLILELIDPAGTTLDPARSRHEVVILDNDAGPGDARPDPFTLTPAASQPPPSSLPPGGLFELQPFFVSGAGAAMNIELRLGIGFRSGAKSAGAPGSAQYSINGGAFTSTPGTVRSGDEVRVRVFAPGTPGETAVVTLIIGGVSSQFSVTTAGSAPVEVRSSGGGLGAGLLLVLGLFAAGRRNTAPRLAPERIPSCD